jgi:hypothetical protein
MRHALKQFIFIAVMAIVSQNLGAQTQAEEYAIFLRVGYLTGYITVTKDAKGKVTITPLLRSEPYDWFMLDLPINGELCPIIPQSAPEFGRQYDYFTVGPKVKGIVIEGNTTTVTWNDGEVEKRVRSVVGNTTTITYSWNNGRKDEWWKEVVSGNTTTQICSNGRWRLIKVDGNTITRSESGGHLSKTVMIGNTRYTTHSEEASGGWDKWDGSYEFVTVFDDNGLITQKDFYSTTYIVTRDGYNIFVTMKK